MAMIEIKNVSKWYGSFQVLKNCSTSVEKGEVVVVCGPSGSGKSTLIKTVNALEPFQQGEVLINGINVGDPKTDLPKLRSHVGMVFQHFELFPHLSITDNLTLAQMKVLGRSREEATERGLALLDRVGLLKHAPKFPGQLSGGQQQRVAIARAIVSEPRLLLLDEPLSNLDAKLRVDMRAELKRLHHETGTTIIYVTHDQVEALTMSTRIALYRKGELVQVAPPLELYDNPVNLYTADFIGNPSINFVKGTAQVEAGGMRVDSSLGQLGFERGDMTEAAPQSGSVDVTIGVRPEQLSISRQADDAHWVEGRVYSGMPAGSETLVSVRVGDTMLTVKELGSTHYASDEPVYLGFNPKKVNVFETKSENLIKYCV